MDISPSFTVLKPPYPTKLNNNTSTSIMIILILVFIYLYVFYFFMHKNLYYLFYSHMRKHTSVIGVEHHLEGKMYSQNTRRLIKMESKKKSMIHHHHPLPKSKESLNIMNAIFVVHLLKMCRN